MIGVCGVHTSSVNQKKTLVRKNYFRMLKKLINRPNQKSEKQKGLGLGYLAQVDKEKLPLPTFQRGAYASDLDVQHPPL